MISLLLFLTINYLVNIRLCKTSFALRYCTKYSIVFAICSPFTVTVTAQLITDLSVVSKLLERHIHFCLHYIWMKTIQFLNSSGATSKENQLLIVIHNWLRILESGEEVCSIFFVLKKAFDSVPHRPLMAKLEKTSLSPHLQEWIRGLPNR